MPNEPGRLQDDVLYRLLAVARELGASADLDRILPVLIDAMRDLLGAERATVFEHDAARGELFATAAHGLAAGAGEDVSEIRIPATAGLAGESASTRRVINVADAHADRRFNPDIDRRTGFRTRSLLTIPLEDEGGSLVGVAQVLNKRGGDVGGVFTEADEQIATALAAHAAIALKRGRLIEDRLQRQKLERDLDIAREIQQLTFPAVLPAVAGFEIAAWGEPADQTGGDTYDAVGAGAGADGSGRALLLLADAVGHGIGPALCATQVRSMLRMLVRMNASLEEIAHHLNEQLTADLPANRFVTAWLGEVTAGDGTLTSFSAGQGPLLHYVRAEDRFELLGGDAPPFGLMPDLDITATRIALAPGDLFLVASDGIFEAFDPDHELFGEERTMEVIRAARARPAAEIVRALRDAVDAHGAGRPADDDRTIVLIRSLGV